MTPIIKGRTPEYNFTAQYIVNVDDFLLYYLQKEYTLIELHQTVGQSFQTIATCKLSLKQLIEGNQGRLHGTARLIASHQNNIDIGTFGAIEYWVRLRVPMEQAFRLLKEKMKAQGYLVTTSRQSTKPSDDIEQRHEADPNMNELTIAILNCANVKAATPGKTHLFLDIENLLFLSLSFLDHQPDLYCIYKFYDFADHDTITIPSSNNPNFDDRLQYPLQMDADLDRYLKQSQLIIFVFDDRDPKDDRYVARADIPLIPLAHDNPIRGTFDLHNDRGEKNGTMDVTLKWTYSYLPPPASTRTPAQRTKSIPTNVREPLALLPDESISGHKTIAEKQKEMNVKLTSRDVMGSDNGSGSKPGRLKRKFDCL
jgi:protein fantom